MARLQSHVMRGGVGEVAALFFSQFPDPAGRGAHPQISPFKHLARGDQAAGTDHGASLDHSAVEYGTPHTNQTVILNRTTVKDDLVAHGNTITNDQPVATGGVLADAAVIAATRIG